MNDVFLKRLFAGLMILIVSVSIGTGTALAQPASPPTDAPDAGRAPVSVELSYFIGSAHPGYILLEWETVSELNTQAFRLYRATVNNPAQAALLNPPGVIQAHLGSITGYYYSWQDSYNLTPGVTYYYWIEDQDSNGTWNLHTDPNEVPVVPYCSLYDVNCSLTVNATDISLVANAWGCDLFDTCYSARYDLDGSYLIGVNDVMTVAGRWGCEWNDACYW